MIEQKSFTNSGGGHHQIRHVIKGNILLVGWVISYIVTESGKREVTLFFGMDIALLRPIQDAFVLILMIYKINYIPTTYIT